MDWLYFRSSTSTWEKFAGSPIGRVALLGIAVVAGGSLGCNSGASAEGAEGRATPALVEVATGRTGELRLARTYLGMVRSVARAELAAGAAGEVVEVAVREGDRVEAGQVLVRIDPDLAQANLRAAEAASRRVRTEREQAARDAARFEAAGPRTVAQLEIDRAVSQASALEAQSESSGAEVARARATLERHRVIAPFDGVVAARRLDPGDWVNPGTPALELVADGQTEVLVRVEPDLLEDVEVGTEATISRGAHTARALVSGVVRALDPATRTAQLRLAPSEAAPWLLPGAAVDVRFELVHGGEGVLVPRDALIDGVAQSRVVKVVDGAAHPVVVQVLERGSQEVRVRAEDLRPDDVVVTRGNERLRPGQPVRIAEDR